MRPSTKLMAGPWEQSASHGVRSRLPHDGALPARRGRTTSPRRARGGLRAVGVADPDEEYVRVYAETKQSRLVDIINGSPQRGSTTPRLLVGLRDVGLAVATAPRRTTPTDSWRRNAPRRALRCTTYSTPIVSGLDAPGKPDPTIFLEAARRLGLPPQACFVIEDAPAGVAAARRGGTACVGGRPKWRRRRTTGHRCRHRGRPARSTAARRATGPPRGTFVTEPLPRDSRSAVPLRGLVGPRGLPLSRIGRRCPSPRAI